MFQQVLCYVTLMKGYVTLMKGSDTTQFISVAISLALQGLCLCRSPFPLSATSAISLMLWVYLPLSSSPLNESLYKSLQGFEVATINYWGCLHGIEVGDTTISGPSPISVATPYL